MKKVLLSLIVFFCSLVTFGQYSGSGSGTSSDPYLIFYADQLNQLRNFLGQEGVNFKLMNDINLGDWLEDNSPSQGWQPIGTESSPFMGVLDGNGKQIINMWMERPDQEQVGFFGATDSATIRNLTITGYVSAKRDMGGFVGLATSSTFSGCHFILNAGKNITSSYAGYSTTGGFVGCSKSSNYINCSVEAQEGSSVIGDSYVGGFCGSDFIAGSYTSCSARISVNATGDRAGGLVGSSSIGTITIESSNAKGNIKGNGIVGGLLGIGDTVQIANSQMTGTITAKGDYVGGAVGNVLHMSSLTSVTARCNVSTQGNYLGGICGALTFIDNASGIHKCSYVGNLLGDSYVGGIVGCILPNGTKPTLKYYAYIDGDGTVGATNCDRFSKGTDFYTIFIENNFSIGSIGGNNYVGGIIGKDGGTSTSYVKAQKIYNLSSYYLQGQNKFRLYETDSTKTKKGDRLSNGADVYKYVEDLITTEIINCYFSGDINGNTNVGGIAGNKRGGAIRKSYANANISAQKQCGGIAGYVCGGIAETWSNNDLLIEISSNVAICNQLSVAEGNVNRIVGEAGELVSISKNGTTTENRALVTMKVSKAGVVQSVADDVMNGAAVGLSSLKYMANYVGIGWNFTDDWTIQETECFPYKSWQTAPPVIKSTPESHGTVISGKSISGGTVYVEIGKDFKGSTTCSNNQWSITVPAMQSGDEVRVYAETEGKGQSYVVKTNVKYPGSGTEADPYRVYTAADLQGVYRKGFYKQMNDIDLTEWITKNSPLEGWPAIGRNGSEKVVYDGNNYKVTGLWCNTTQDYNGLFSNFDNGTIKNLTVETATGKQVKGGMNTAILVGRIANGSIENVKVKGIGVGSTRAGGITAIAEKMNFNEVSFDGSVEITSTDNDLYGVPSIGGLAANMLNGSITNSKVNVTLTSTGVHTGGLVGCISGAIVKSDTAIVEISVNNDSSYVGGLIGSNDATTISQCVSIGHVSSIGSQTYVGGLVGQNQSAGIVENSYSTAEVNSSLYGAGLVGYNYGKVEKSYACGSVYSGNYAAGLVGYNDKANATTAYSMSASPFVNVSTESGWSIRVVGGYKNGAPEVGENNIALDEMQLSVNGVQKKVSDNILDGYGRTKELLYQQNTYETLGWDFSEIWMIDEGQSYPYLRKQGTEDDNPDTNKEAIDALRALVDSAQTIYDEAIEGGAIGNYAVGSKQPLMNAINEVRSQLSDNMTLETVETCSNNLKAAIATFKSQIIAEEIVDKDNMLLMENVNTMAGKQIVIPVMMSNVADITALQADLYLPTGFTIATDEDDEYLIDVGSRTTYKKHSISTLLQPDGSIRIVCASTTKALFNGNSGEVINITLNISEDQADGDYIVSLRNVTLADVDANSYVSPNADCTVTLRSYKPGDVNNDGTINVADIPALTSFILGNAKETFIFAAADLNNDKTVKVDDYVSLVNIILQGIKSKVFMPKAITTIDGVPMLSMENLNIQPGEMKEIVLRLKGYGEPFTALQVDLKLPEGLHIVSESTNTSHQVQTCRQDKGQIRLVCASMRNALMQEEQAITLKIKADENMPSGKYIIVATDPLLARVDATTYEPELVTACVTVGDVTGIKGRDVNKLSIVSEKNKVTICSNNDCLVTIFSTAGQLIRTVELTSGVDQTIHLTPGIYLINGKKVTIK